MLNGNFSLFLACVNLQLGSVPVSKCTGQQIT